MTRRRACVAGALLVALAACASSGARERDGKTGSSTLPPSDFPSEESIESLAER